MFSGASGFVSTNLFGGGGFTVGLINVSGANSMLKGCGDACGRCAEAVSGSIRNKYGETSHSSR